MYHFISAFMKRRRRRRNLNIGPQMVVPSLPALLPYPTIEMLSNFRPFLLSIVQHHLNQQAAHNFHHKSTKKQPKIWWKFDFFLKGNRRKRIHQSSWGVHCPFTTFNFLRSLLAFLFCTLLFFFFFRSTFFSYPFPGVMHQKSSTKLVLPDSSKIVGQYAWFIP